MEIDFEAVEQLCCFCGLKMVFGEEYNRCVESSIARGSSREEASSYFLRSIYMECPEPEKHTKGHPLVPLEELEHGAYYLGSCRNARMARWNGEMKHFVYMRQKFDSIYPEEIGYWVTAKPGEHRFDEYKPYCKRENPPFEIPLVAWERK